jgi:hypothetical protein
MVTAHGKPFVEIEFVRIKPLISRIQYNHFISFWLVRLHKHHFIFQFIFIQ